MYKIFLPLLLSFFLVQAPVSAQKKSTKSSTAVKKKRDADGIDGRMKGPNGEVVYIGERGGRYYFNAGKKVYLPYNGNKNKSTKTAVKKMVDAATR